MIGAPWAASMVGIIAVGVVLPSEPKLKVFGCDLRSSNVLMPVLARTHTIEFTAPGLPT